MNTDAAVIEDWPALLAAARNGDDEALGQVCEQLRHYLWIMADNGLGTDLQAKLGASDVVQDTMLDAVDDFRSFRGRTEAEFRAWIKRLIEHNLIDSARRFRDTQARDTSREVSAEELDCGAGEMRSASSLIRRRETDEELLRAIAKLPPRQRQIIELRHRQGLTYQEIAKQLEMTEVAARKLWSRTVEQLRDQLTSDHASSAPRAK
ncbi:RNA polymerase sigma factor [Bythopirellula goksoeyrii]|uniref:ECF RNA polymerase sigma factor SigD n=1 Tax=Bythopirellula goksoeyrii TaxID=1400387 RepID=A0A5B9Q3M6_9BACT|nr:sigma-70 family RNA polymerase sigma factor [Bythopirellula goksoeyrii]QEG33577.1 ECF RNA polymerase sigma factor SigD [Bythopirellula goksoeyrii]